MPVGFSTSGTAFCKVPNVMPFHGVPLMPVRLWPRLLTLFVVCGVSACSGNYIFDDHTYRPLGDPHALNRSK